MKFEFQLEQEEKDYLNKLNKVRMTTPLKLIGVITAAVSPSILILVLLESWFVLGLAILFVSILLWTGVRQLQRPPAKVDRGIALSPTAITETVGKARTTIKWDRVDDIRESRFGFLFERKDRFSLLPRRVMDSTQADEVREFLLKIRNEPENGHLPLPEFNDYFIHRDGGEAHRYKYRDDDVGNNFAPLIVRINPKELSVNDVARRMKPRKNWFRFALLALSVVPLGILTSMAMHNHDFSAGLMIVALTFPFLFLFGGSLFERWITRRNLPRIPREENVVRILTDGWAVGDENAVSFSRWSKSTEFFLSQTFVGIRSESQIVQLIPVRAFFSSDAQKGPRSKQQRREDATAVFNFLQNAINAWREQILEDERETATDPATVQAETGNPYQAPNLN